MELFPLMEPFIIVPVLPEVVPLLFPWPDCPPTVAAPPEVLPLVPEPVVLEPAAGVCGDAGSELVLCAATGTANAARVTVIIVII